MHEELLAEVISEWTATGVLPDLVELVREVWKTNVDRHEPMLGDDPLTLGLVSSRNLANRTVEEFRRRHGVAADLENNSLRVVHQGRTLRAYKLPGRSVAADPEDADWDSSGTKLQGPAENTVWRQPTLFDHLPAAPPELRDRNGPKYLHLAWAGDPETGEVAVHLGFPCEKSICGSPWLAVELVYTDEQPDTRTVRPSSAAPAASYDERPAPTVEVGLREEPREQAGRESGSDEH